MRKNWIFCIGIACFLLLSGCAGFQTKPPFEPTADMKPFAECPGGKCYVSSNNNFVAIWESKIGWGDRPTEVYRAQDLKKVASLNDIDKLKSEYGIDIKECWLNGDMGHIGYDIEEADDVSKISNLGGNVTYEVEMPEGFSRVESVTELKSKLVLVFREESFSHLGNTDKLCLGICDKEPSSQLQPRVIFSGDLPRFKRNVGQKLGSLLLGGNKQWKNIVSVVPCEDNISFFLGITSSLVGCNSSSCKDYDYTTRLRRLDLTGSVLGEIRSDGDYGIINYGELYKIDRNLLALKEKSINNEFKSTHCLIKPSTAMVKEVSQSDYLVGFSPYHLFYSPDGKTFYRK
jgi:hypothetical protein